ncbi:MAG: hypothetical protein JW982_08265, partial [Spirochaetes bacterium]|nr:hypothetical protein [Spirochaetota bacterium]
MKKIIIIYLILNCISIHAESKLISILPEGTFFISDNQQSFLKLDVILEKNGYIYGNPKGPGIGRETMISAGLNSVNINEIFISTPQKYYADSSPEWVNIYKNNFQIYIPLKVQDIKNENKITVKIDALFCTNESCSPVVQTDEFILRKSQNSSPNILKSLPSDTVSIKTVNSIADKAETNRIQIEFKPVELKKNNISGIFSAILFGLIAGLILNFMPCVLPVISLKILSFIRNADHNSSVLKKTGLVFTAGIIISFLILSSIITFFGLNWGALFQSSSFIYIIIIVMFIMSLSLFGIYSFKIPALAAKGSQIKSGSIYTEAFLHGFLATLLATPCSGPFLGATLTWTLTQPVIIIYSVFISIGIGMSLPYLIISFNPRLIKFIPKPGKWMITFEKIIGIFIIAAVIYFLTLLNLNNLKAAIWSLFIIYLAFIQFGKFGSIDKSFLKRIISSAVLFILIAAGYYIPQKIFMKQSEIRKNTEQYSPDLFSSMQEDGIYLIKFTADWCINCRVIDSTLYNTEKFKSFSSDTKIKIISADLSESNPDAELLLNSLGSRSIPFAAVFTKKNISTPVILRDIYTLTDVKNAVSEIKSEENKFELKEIEFED